MKKELFAVALASTLVMGAQAMADNHGGGKKAKAEKGACKGHCKGKKAEKDHCKGKCKGKNKCKGDSCKGKKKKHKGGDACSGENGCGK